MQNIIKQSAPVPHSQPGNEGPILCLLDMIAVPSKLAGISSTLKLLPSYWGWEWCIQKLEDFQVMIPSSQTVVGL